MYCFRCVLKKHEPERAARRRIPKPKRPGRKRRLVHVLLLFVASVIVVDGLVGDRGLLAMLRARQEYDAMSATITQLRAENARLREDPSAIEEIARRELGLIKPGERVFIVKDVPPAKP